MKENYIISIFKTFNFMDIKVLFISVIASIITFMVSFAEDYLGISGKFALALAVLILADFITGIMSSYKHNINITSSKGVRTLYKTGAYMLFLYVAFSLQSEIPVEAVLFNSIIKYFHIYIIAHICIWELFSVDENLKKLGVNLGLTDLLKGVLEKIKSIGIKK